MCLSTVYNEKLGLFPGEMLMNRYMVIQDEEGNPVLCSEGYAGYIDGKDEDGTTISRTLLGTDGKAAEISAGYSEIRYFYDEY